MPAPLPLTQSSSFEDIIFGAVHGAVEEAMCGPLDTAGLFCETTWESEVEFVTEMELPIEKEPQIIQIQTAPIDLKPGLLRNAKVSSKGVRYQIVPLKWQYRNGQWTGSGGVSPEDKRGTVIVNDVGDNALREIGKQFPGAKIINLKGPLEEYVQKMLPNHRQEFLRQLMSQGHAVDWWAEAAGERMIQGPDERYYWQPTGWRGQLNAFKAREFGERFRSKSPLQAGQGVTFRTVTNQPEQAAKWWLPSRTQTYLVEGWTMPSGVRDHLQWLGVI